MTKDQALQLTTNTVLHHKTRINADETPLRARVNGKCKTWKTRPTHFRVPMKYGLRTYFYLTQDNADEWELPETQQ